MKELEDKCEYIDRGYFNESDISSYYIIFFPTLLSTKNGQG